MASQDEPLPDSVLPPVEHLRPPALAPPQVNAFASQQGVEARLQSLTFADLALALSVQSTLAGVATALVPAAHVALSHFATAEQHLVLKSLPAVEMAFHASSEAVATLPAAQVLSAAPLHVAVSVSQQIALQLSALPGHWDVSVAAFFFWPAGHLKASSSQVAFFAQHAVVLVASVAAVFFQTSR
jgi:hypothetical protein